MALTASALISAARKRAFGVTGRQKVSKAMLLEELSYQDQLVVQMVSQIAPDLLSRVTGSITVSDTGNTNGYTLVSGMHYRDFTHKDPSDNTYRPINILQRQHRDNLAIAHPAGMINTASAAAVFYPIDPQRRRWQTTGDRQWFEPAKSHEFTYSYIPIPAVLTAVSDTLSSPDMAREIFTSALEVVILLSNPREAETYQIRLQAALAARAAALESFRFQAYKFAQPQGQPGGVGDRLGEALWVNDQVAR